MLICEKPVGVESQRSSVGKEDMLTLLEAYRREKGEDSYVGLVHRLDTATGGAMIYSKRADMTGKLSALVQSGDYKKTYLAVVHGEPDAELGELRDLLYHDKQKNKSYVCDKVRQGVKEAIANYRLLETVERESGEKTSLVEVELITGRTHQIRVQLASRKMPLVGDGKYGSRDNKATCALWSHKVEFTHPVTKKKIEAVSLPEKIYPWDRFIKLK
ncbi:MAG: RNA pseudouridine synthase [Clostridia bacterium]|nr:RNA pseudouridine synthase [Clostridia bacterium]